MKKLFFIIAMLSSIPAFAEGPIGYPGSDWTSFTTNPSPIRGTPENNNYLLQGNIQQGIDWLKIGKSQWVFNTYAALGYSVDHNALYYDNKLTPALGLKFRRDYTNSSVEVGVQAIHQDNFRGVTEGANNGNGVQLFINYWTGWNLKH